jgi:hypothetical protein
MAIEGFLMAVVIFAERRTYPGRQGHQCLAIVKSIFLW